jgi:hypothetical protein
METTCTRLIHPYSITFYGHIESTVLVHVARCDLVVHTRAQLRRTVHRGHVDTAGPSCQYHSARWCVCVRRTIVAIVIDRLVSCRCAGARTAERVCAARTCTSGSTPSRRQRVPRETCVRTMDTPTHHDIALLECEYGARA